MFNQDLIPVVQMNQALVVFGLFATYTNHPRILHCWAGWCKRKISLSHSLPPLSASSIVSVLGFVGEGPISPWAWPCTTARGARHSCVCVCVSGETQEEAHNIASRRRCLRAWIWWLKYLTEKKKMALNPGVGSHTREDGLTKTLSLFLLLDGWLVCLSYFPKKAHFLLISWFRPWNLPRFQWTLGDPFLGSTSISHYVRLSVSKVTRIT